MKVYLVKFLALPCKTCDNWNLEKHIKIVYAKDFKEAKKKIRIDYPSATKITNQTIE